MCAAEAGLESIVRELLDSEVDLNLRAKVSSNDEATIKP